METAAQFKSRRIKEGLKARREKRWDEWVAGNIEGGNEHGLFGWARDCIKARRGEACQKCGWKEKNPITGKVPVECHHAGDLDDHRFESIELLCPNCHSLTDSYRPLNKGSGRRYRRTQK